MPLPHNFIIRVVGLLLIAAMFLLNGLRDLGAGTSTLVYREVKRSEDGYLYWWAVGISLALGIAFLVLCVLELVAPQVLPK